MTGSNQVALVSGAASGIGLETTRELCRRGWTVYAGYRPEGRSLPDGISPPGSLPAPHLNPATSETAGGCIHWVPLDVTDPGARASAVATIERAHQHLDALINCAGINASGPLEEVSDRVLRHVMEVNFFGSMGLTRDCLPLMRRCGGGAIVMLSSLSGLIGLPFNGAYAASKFALEGATESLRYEVAPFRIRVALIQPGAYATSLADINATASASTYAAFERMCLARTHSSTEEVGEELPSARRIISGGADPHEAALTIVSTVCAATPPLRIPCGAQAEAVTAQLRTIDDEQRHEFALRAAGVS
jgi:NAD(P)-dependent dehydrogenase (short-subunit alcohol dehydrogenase family)